MEQLGTKRPVGLLQLKRQVESYHSGKRAGMPRERPGLGFKLRSIQHLLRPGLTGVRLMRTDRVRVPFD